jgi:L-alanine-DL-glutamate epimerase-like enolase superfamily enzyme
MRLESIEAEAVFVPLAAPTAFSTRELKGREYVIVRVVDQGGASGVGYTYAGDTGGLWLRNGIEELLAPRLRGRSIFAIEETWESIFRDLLLLGRRGALLRMLSAVEIAHWDLLAKRAGLPLRYLLGGSQDNVAAYASGGYYRPGDPCDNVAAELGRYQELGFTDFKLKFGGLPLEEDLERVATARRVLEPGARLALDINNGWQTLAQAMRAVEALRTFDIWWIEEPFLPDDVANHCRLAARSSIAIATGEIEATRWGFAQLLREHAAHILQPDACVAGGISEWRRIAALAAAHDIPVAPHWHANLHAQLAAATPSCITVEYFALDEGIYNFERLVANPLTIDNGRITLGDETGIGVELDWDAVARHAIAETPTAARRAESNGQRTARRAKGMPDPAPVPAPTMARSAPTRPLEE